MKQFHNISILYGTTIPNIVYRIYGRKLAHISENIRLFLVDYQLLLLVIDLTYEMFTFYCDRFYHYFNHIPLS